MRKAFRDGPCGEWDYWKSFAQLTAWLFVFFGIVPSARGDEVSSTVPRLVRVVAVAEDSNENVLGISLGTGFLISEHSIITNAHVVQPDDDTASIVSVFIVPARGKGSIRARMLRVEPGKDLALLTAEGMLQPPLTIYSGPIPDGSQVVALGYPANVDRATATSLADYAVAAEPIRSQGNYANLRVIDGIHAVLHTAPIARGNSGGPLLDGCGRVVGVNTFTTKSEVGDAQFAFAISSDELTAFLRRSGLSFRRTAQPCLSASERSAASQANWRLREERRRVEAVARLRTQGARNAIELRQSRRREENWIGATVIGGIIGLIFLILAAILLSAKRFRSGTSAAIAGLLLSAVSATSFFLRPQVKISSPAGDEGLANLASETSGSGDVAASGQSENAVNDMTEADATTKNTQIIETANPATSTGPAELPTPEPSSGEPFDATGL